MRLRTFLLFTFCLMTLTLCANGDALGADVDTILKGVIDGSRRVLAFGAFSNQSLAIVSASKDANIAGASVVDITLSGKKVLFNSAMLLKDKWPKATLPNGKMALVLDDKGVNLLIDSNGKLYAMSLATPTTVNDLSLDSDNYQTLFGDKPLVSALQKMTVYSISHDPSIVSEGVFKGNQLIGNLELVPKTDSQPWGSKICKTDSGEVEFDIICQNGNIPWNLAAGFVSLNDVFLVDFANRKILTFAAPFVTGKPRNVTTIPFASFWAKGTSSGPKPVTSNLIPHKRVTPASSHLAFIIICVIILIAVLIAVAVVYWLLRRASKRKHSGDDEEAAPNSRASKEDGEEGKGPAPVKLARRKSSKGSGRRRKSSKRVSSKRRVSSGRVSSRRGSSLKRRASGKRSGRVASGREIYLKRNTGIKGLASLDKVPGKRPASAKKLPSIKYVVASSAAVIYGRAGQLKRQASSKMPASSAKGASASAAKVPPGRPASAKQQATSKAPVSSAKASSAR